MFQKFRARFADRKKVKQIKKKIHLAYELIYTEKYDLMEDVEQEKFIQKVSGTSNPIQLIESYFIVNRITKYSLPISENGIADLKQELDNIKLELNSPSKNLQGESQDLQRELQEAYLVREKAKVSCNLLIRQQHLITGKKAFDEDPYSFMGMIYSVEKAARSPISLPELEKLKDLHDQLNEAKKNIDARDLELEELNNEIAELKQLKEEIEKSSLEKVEQSLLKDMKLVSDIENLLNQNSKNEDL